MIVQFNKKFFFTMLLVVFLFIFLVSANLTLELISPSGLIGSSTVVFNYSISGDADNCSLYHDVNSWNLISTAYNVEAGYNSFIDSISSQGAFYWNIICFNNSVSFSASQNQSFIMDLSPPSISLISPFNSSKVKDYPVQFIYSVSDYGVIDNCSLLINDVVEETSFDVAKDVQQSFSVQLLPNSYNWSVVCFDSFARQGLSEDFHVIVSGDLIWNVSSLFLGSTHSNGGSLSGGASLNIVNLNNNIDLICSGDCSKITTNFISTSGQNEEFLIMFHCSSNDAGSFSAVFNASSDEFVDGALVSVSCDIYEAKPNFYVNNSLFYYTGNLVEGEVVQLKIDVYNFGDVDAENVNVSFFDDDVFIGFDLLNVLSQGFNTAVVDYEISSGNKIIRAVVNPDNLIDEYDSLNNEAFLNLNISSWQFLTGNVSGRFVLEDGSSNIVYDWPKEIIEGSMLYVVDVDSSIDWSSLRALSRDAGGNLRLQDFEIADEFLNISDNYDSLVNTFSDFLSDDFLLFGNLVSDVPHFYTNEPDFFTGVVWDYSSDTDGFYGGNDKEDLVFFTRLKDGIDTDFGSVNYQIKFVANLRQYVGGSDNVAIYIELI